MTILKDFGLKGEKLVGQYLEKKNFKILAYNFTTKLGEVDIIAQKDEYIVFVEVKTRNSVYFPISKVITTSKQKKIIKSAKYFIFKNRIVDRAFRFDVAIVTRLNDLDFDINYIENAFYS